MPEASRSLKTWLTVEETAAVLGLSAMTIYRLIAAGEFPAVRYGRRICVPSEALEALAKAAITGMTVVTAADWREVRKTG